MIELKHSDKQSKIGQPDIVMHVGNDEVSLAQSSQSLHVVCFMRLSEMFRGVTFD